ncbi:hypothetical protein V5O48_001861 [Marasmius crinis-equi]|uniref:F-box domain-containing protein n=1 Tax=Marasmius crinis-equi TaxID=585013 RepID=A0ABR3FXC7_9AGAR
MSPDVDVSSLRPGGDVDSRRISAENSLLVSDEQLFADLGDVIAFHEGLVNKMKADRVLLQHRIWTRKAFSAPIRRLPTEVLEEILLSVCAQERYDWFGQPIHPVAMYGNQNRNVPSTLAQVCARWNLVVYNNPRFWASLTIGVPRTEVGCRRLAQVLDHSYPLPLTLAVEGNSTYPPITSFLLLLISALARTFDLHVDYEFIAQEDLGGVIDCRGLTRLFVHVRGMSGAAEQYGYSRTQLASLIQAPALESFGTDSFTELARYDLYPHSALTAFECGKGGTIQQRHLTELLRRCPDLRSVSIAIPFGEYDNGYSASIVLSKLERLAYDCDRSYGSLLLDTFITPSLIELVLPIGVSEDIWCHVIRFIDRSDCRLRSLECTLPWSFIEDPSGWIATFSRLVDLESLRVKVSGKTSWTGENCLGMLFQVLSGDVPILRKLRSLHVISRGDDWKDPDLEDMERLAALFLSFVERRSAQNQVKNVVSLREVRLVVESRHAWGDKAGDPIGGMLAVRRDALLLTGMACEIIFPSV